MTLSSRRALRTPCRRHHVAKTIFVCAMSANLLTHQLILLNNFVDYSPRGPENVLEGASAGVGALTHVFGSGVKDVVVKPAQVGTVVFADHLATGDYNNVVGNDDKTGSLIVGNKKLLNSLGFNTRNVHLGSMSVEERLLAIITSPSLASTNSVDDNAISVHVDGATFDDRNSVAITFGDGENVGKVLQEDQVQELASEKLIEEKMQEKSLKSLNGKPPPKMNICMMTTGSWEGSVQQYVVIVLLLQLDGHRVRIATHSAHRNRIVMAGLDFYPLGEKALTADNFLQYLYQRTQDKSRHKSRLLGVAYEKLNHRRESIPDVDELREIIFSLWPACVDVDPSVHGKAFRADAIIAHPYLFGHTIVAKRLGVPLHCMRCNPHSRTQAFPHLLSANMKLYRPYRYAPTNAASYDAHTYLWNPVFLPKPHDWGSEITIVGYVELEEHGLDSADLTTIEQNLQAFVENAAGTPLVYFGFQCDNWDPRRCRTWFPRRCLLGNLTLDLYFKDMRAAMKNLLSSLVARTLSGFFSELTSFMTLHPTKYADLLKKKLQEHKTPVYLINTGWTGGVYGVGKHMKLPFTRKCVGAMLDGSITEASFVKDPLFGFEIPTTLKGVPSEILNPRDTW
ncbi:hypothetical protein PsorP6_010585 [Peronosclerospora sorghi]|uniref:Uncharacterized protein n=1 Tax=Peronosclerospora sorghi TaxID=230839 RepID=A0ACC0VU45_9STRA|nr:hypothetical protein PsorP6_010585 [Peronosclerospora sorghi]